MKTVSDVIAEVISTHEGAVSTHYATCYRYHAGCLAVMLRDLLAEEWEGVTVRGLPAPRDSETGHA